MRTLALLGFLFASSPTYAQTWSRTYPTAGEDVLWKALEASDGTLFVSGFSSTDGSLLARLGPDGAVLWSFTLPASIGILRDHALAANGDVLACGENHGGALVLRLDPNGAVLWQRELPWWYSGYEDSLSFVFTAITEASNGDVLLAGQMRSDPCEDPHQLYVRLDPSGSWLWGFYGNYGWLTDVRELPDGSVAFAGAAYWSGVSYLRTAADGQELSERILDPLGGSRARVSLTADGNLLVVPGCFTCNYYYSQDVGLEGWSDPVEPFEVSAIDSDGDVLWRRGYGAAPDVATDVLATPDGGAVVLGETLALGGDRDVRLVRLDPQGALSWQLAYGGQGEERATAVTALADGGFLVTGRTDSGTATGLDGLLLRVDAAGQIAGCPTTVTWRSEELLASNPTVIDPGGWRWKDTMQRTDLVATPTALPAEDHCLGFPGIGSAYCSPAIANSTGAPAEVHAIGSTLLTEDDVTLVAISEPAGTFGYFLTGTGSGQVIPPGSQGRLCLTGSSIHRYAKSVLTSDEDGWMSLAIDVDEVPGHGAILSGETWNFQAWFRDQNPAATSNFTDAVAVTFL